MINLLFITNDRSQHLSKEPFYLSKELSKLTNLTLWFSPGNIKEILKEIPKQPDFILLNDVDKMTAPHVVGFADIEIPCGMMIEDPHKNVGGRGKFIEDNKISYVFPIKRDGFLERYPKLNNKMWWFPHHVNTEVFKDYELNKDINYLMLGKIDRLYPLRQAILTKMKSEPGFKYHNHPGYRSFSKTEEEKRLIGENYARTINRAKLFFTCDSILKYPIKKYFEVPACRTLLLAPTSKEIEDLGFIPDKHFVAINEDNFYEKAQYYLINETERQKIADEGYEFIRKYHSTKVRAVQLVEKINELLEGVT